MPSVCQLYSGSCLMCLKAVTMQTDMPIATPSPGGCVPRYGDIKAQVEMVINTLQWSWNGGILVSHRPSVCPSLRLSVAPSVCGQNCVRTVSSTILTKPDPFHIYTFTHFGIFCNFDFVLFWLGIWYESIVWVNMRWRGYSQNASILVALVISVLFDFEFM